MPRSNSEYCIGGLFAVLAFLSMALCNLRAQTTEGKEFWLVFQKNFRDSVTDEKTDKMRPGEPIKLQITITAAKETKGYIECPSVGLHQPFEVKGGDVTTLNVDPALQLTSSGIVEKKVLHVVADAPISVCAGNNRFQTTDTYLAFPADALGQAYRAVGYKWLAEDLLSQFAVAAAEDNTTVTITPSMKTKTGNSAGIPFTVILNRGEVYQVISRFDPTREGDLTGSLITADKPVALFSGHNCAYVPDRLWKACNLLVEQLPPVDAWGKEFVVGAFAKLGSSVIRVVAHRDGTEVFANGGKVATLKAGEFYENVWLMNSTLIKASEPILVVQYAKGFSSLSAGGSNPDSLGDPMMIVLPPVDQYLKSYNFSTPYAGIWYHYVNVMTETSGVSKIRLDGIPVPADSFTIVPGTKYSVAQIKVEEGTHRVEGDVRFGLYNYGLGYGDNHFDAYGSSCGQGLGHLDYDLLRTPAISQDEKGKKEKEGKLEVTVKENQTKTKSTTPVTPIIQPPPTTQPAKESDNTKNKEPKIEAREKGR